MTQQTISDFSSGGRVASPAFRETLTEHHHNIGLAHDVDRYHLLTLIKRVGKSLGFTPALIRLLDYYMAFTREGDWQCGKRPIVYQSVTKTARDLGLSERQIQNLERSLFDLGALTWNDSGNHRRYGARDEQTGELLFAYGVDLTPLAALKPVLDRALEEKTRQNTAWLEQKRQISWYRRQIRALLSETESKGHKDLEELSARYHDISFTLRAYMPLSRLQELAVDHKALYQELLQRLRGPRLRKSFNIASLIFASRDVKNFAHIQITNQPKPDKSGHRNPSQDRAVQESTSQHLCSQSNVSADCQPSSREQDPIVSSGLYHITFEHLKVCLSERFIEHMPYREESWSFISFIEAAYHVRMKLSISQAAWGDACAVLGRTGAAICLLLTDRAMDREGDPVRRPGGYFRALTSKARAGELRLQASIFGILKTKTASGSICDGLN